MKLNIWLVIICILLGLTFSSLTNRGDEKDVNNSPITKDSDRLASDEQDACFLSTRGLSRGKQGDLKGALRDLDKSIEINPSHGYHWNNRSFVRFKLGDLQGALSDNDRSLQIVPDNAEAYANRYLIHSALKHKDAWRDLKEAERLEPSTDWKTKLAQDVHASR